MELAHSPSSCNKIRLQAKPSIQQRQIGPHLSHLQTPLFPRSQQPFPAFHQTACKQVRAAQQKRQKEGTDPRTHALTGVAEVLAPPAKDGTRNVLSTRVGEQRQRLLAKRGGSAGPGLPERSNWSFFLGFSAVFLTAWCLVRAIAVGASHCSRGRRFRFRTLGTGGRVDGESFFLRGQEMVK